MQSRYILWLVLLGLGSCPCAPVAVASEPGLVCASAPAAADRPPLPGATPVLVPASMEWWERAYDAFAAAVSNQRRMVQFMTVIAALALMIIWWRK